ncbi:TPA: ABC transporter permease [Candidatus Poribacteria bacterium]|nr:ABC transporter permease [Candidatus Poribacteria bacterium]
MRVIDINRVRPLISSLNKNRELFALSAFLGLVAVGSLLSPYFLTPTNIKNILSQVSIIAVLAAGETYVILTGGIDLSVGSLLAATGAITAALIKWLGLPILVGILGGLIVGAMAGAINGLFVSRIRIPSFIITLAMMAVARGVALIVTGGKPISIFPPQFTAIAGYIGPVPMLIVITVAVYTIWQFILSKARIGRYIYAVGGNEEATRFLGVKVGLVKLVAFTFSGFCAGLSGIMLTARLDSAYPAAGQGYELDAIAASVLGGVSFTGGIGSLIGTFLGALVMTIIGNLLNLLNVSAFYQYIAKGMVLAIAAVSLSRGVKYAK